MNGLGENIEIINSSFGQSLFNIDNGQLSPYLDLDQIKREQCKRNLLLNTLIADKYPLSSSLIVSGDQSDLVNQSKQYSPSFVQFQLLNDSIPDHQSIIISSISSNSTHTTTVPSTIQQTANNQPHQFAEQSDRLSSSINHKNDDHKTSGHKKSRQNGLKNSPKSVRSQWIIKRDFYRSNSIELSTCFWYSMAIACHQNVPFKRRFVIQIFFCCCFLPFPSIFFFIKFS